ncbi:MAG: undecaprenyldiphospho-muramoylpentapeptide beta-N-acetylglucosaminyltransferase [Woeseiaceae bacterium]
MMRAPILMMAGGTGGHIYPALAIARSLEQHAQSVVWLGTPHGLEARVVPAAGIPMERISISGLRGRGFLGWLTAPFRLGWSVFQSWRIIRRLAPKMVIGMGGFVSGPGGIAAKLAGVPLLIHEQNAIAGMTNRWLAKVAGRVLQGFEGAFSPAVEATTVGNPVRGDVRAIAPPAQRYNGRDGSLRLLVVGGSLGAKALNETVAPAIALMAPEQRPTIRHQAGSPTLGLAQDAYAAAGIRAEVTPFIEDMAGALSWADLVICRAGAITIAELINVGLPAVLVPFPHAVDDHQTANARSLVEAGAALLLPQSEMSPERLQSAMTNLGMQRETLLDRANKARALRGQDPVSLVLAACARLIDDEALSVEAS